MKQCVDLLFDATALNATSQALLVRNSPRLDSKVRRFVTEGTQQFRRQRVLCVS